MYVVVMTTEFKAGTEEARSQGASQFRQALLNSKGFKKCIAGRSSGDPNTIVTITMWESAADSQAFRGSAERNQVLNQTAKLRASEPKGQEFEATVEI